MLITHKNQTTIYQYNGPTSSITYSAASAPDQSDDKIANYSPLLHNQPQKYINITTVTGA